MRAAVLAIALLAAAGCRSNPNYCEGSPDNSCAGAVDGDVGADAPGERDAPASGGSGSDATNAYRPTTVQFALSYLTVDSFADVQSSPKGVFSAWLKFDASDGTEQYIFLEQYGWGVGGVLRTTDNKIRFYLRECNGDTTVDMQTTTAVTAEHWVHVLAAWDASLGLAKIYLDDNLDVAAGTVIKSGNKVCYTPPTPPHTWGIGGVSANALGADVADMYAALGSYQNIDDMLVRRRFIDGNKKPVDLGPQCQLPAGAASTLCLRGDFATWGTNRGAGGGFTLGGGSLSLSTTNPAD